MSLFDTPHPAHLADGGRPVLWFGLEVIGSEPYVLVANETGRLSMFPIAQIIADVRHVTERENIVPGVSGPGWVDLEDLSAGKVTEQIFGDKDAIIFGDKDAIYQPTADAPERPPALLEGVDYITDKEGNWFDIETGKELDKSTGQPIE